MKNKKLKTNLKFFLIQIFAIFLLSSGCRTINYYTPPPNNGFFNNAGEVHVSGNININNMDASGGVAVTKNISLIGTYGGCPQAYNTLYGGSESEVGMAIYNTHTEGFVYGGAFGYGSGNTSGKDNIHNNYNTFFGNFTKPFFQLTAGTAGTHANAAFTLKVDFLNYRGSSYINNGMYQAFNDKEPLFEPYFSGEVGGNGDVVRFQYGTGFIIQNDWNNGFRVFPWQFNIGFVVMLNRKAEK